MLTLISFVSNLHVVRIGDHVDIDHEHIDQDINQKSISDAKALVRAMEAAARSIYDDCATFLAQSQAFKDGQGARDTLDTLVASMGSNFDVLGRILATLLSTCDDQPELSLQVYESSIDWGMSQLTLIPSQLAVYKEPMANGIWGGSLETLVSQNPLRPGDARGSMPKRETVESKIIALYTYGSLYQFNHITFNPTIIRRRSSIPTVASGAAQFLLWLNGSQMTFKSFTNVDDLFALLVQRFHIQPPDGLKPKELEDWTTQKQYIIQMRYVPMFQYTRIFP